MGNPNFLILDEPTNDLDIFVMSVLEDYLRAFDGCLIVVSHDRYFMDKMVDHLFVCEGEGEVKDILGNYTVFRQKQIDAKRDKQVMVARNASTEPEKSVLIKVEVDSNTPRKLNFKEKIELEQIEKDLEKLELDKEKFTQILSNVSSSNQELIDAGIKLKEIMDSIEIKTERWMELVG
jgi:ATP-binding cassette subfamily F protein uup